MNAKEARELTDLHNNKAMDMMEVLEAIKEKAEVGEAALTIYDKSLPDAVVAKLGKLGYKVNALNEDFKDKDIPIMRYIISW